MPLRLLQGSLILAAVGSAVILVGLFATPVELAALGAVVHGTELAAPAAREPGGGWWGLLAAGATLSAAGALLSLLSETLGGLVAVLGGVAVVTAAAMGFPLERS